MTRTPHTGAICEMSWCCELRINYIFHILREIQRGSSLSFSYVCFRDSCIKNSKSRWVGCEPSMTRSFVSILAVVWRATSVMGRSRGWCVAVSELLHDKGGGGGKCPQRPLFACYLNFPRKRDHTARGDFNHLCHAKHFNPHKHISHINVFEMPLIKATMKIRESFHFVCRFELFWRVRTVSRHKNTLKLSN